MNPKNQIKSPTTYFSKNLLKNYHYMKSLEYKVINSCITDCLDIDENEIDLKNNEKECLRKCHKNVVELFKISAKNYEISQIVHSPQTFKDKKRKLTTDMVE